MKKIFFNHIFLFVLIYNLFLPVNASKIKIAVLKFGSVNWELDVIKHHKLDKKNNIIIQKMVMTNKDAATLAFLSKSVDIFVTDWIWVSKQRNRGNLVTFVPYSNAAGALMTKEDQNINSFSDFENKKVGIAGGSLDKSWLFLRAYGIKKYGYDPLTFFDTSFAAPPLINGLLRNNQLDAGFNYWNYTARLEAQGYKKFINLNQILSYIGINGELPLIGYVFRESFMKKNKKSIENFIKTSNEARKILKLSDEEWVRIYKITGAKNTLMLEKIKDSFREGIPTNNHQLMKKNIKDAYKILADLGGKALVGNTTILSPGTYWQETR